ncbi:hypothetical protein BVRB_5g107440 isoform B [Beta vulgaris subsp. vulgaris]|nr:hypothetical protein BVRB_5g107440 isoform B [Beta vulgaris subsp. vulgaris]
MNIEDVVERNTSIFRHARGHLYVVSNDLATYLAINQQV